jgi:hypothetical protein
MGVFPSGLLGALALSLSGYSRVDLFLAIHFLVWGLCDALIWKKFGKKFGLTSLVAWILRELLAFPLWSYVISGSSVKWRGQEFKLQAGGLLQK